jgi:D-alanyl-D-alanine carboxypeptidase (penicillin-binding protein 5/6)
MRTPTVRLRVAAASVLAAVVLAPSAALAAPVVPLGPLAVGPRSALGGDLLAGTGTARSQSPGVPGLPAVSATSFLVADAGTGAVLAARDAHGRYAPASTLKTLTALALIPAVPADSLVRPAAEDVNIEGSKVGLVRTLSYPASQLFTALMAVSGNDAAGALATAVGGQAAATALMNTEAQRLKARDTLAVNTSGLDAQGQLSSAYDLALIAREGLTVPDFRAYASTRKSFVNGPGGKTIEIYTHNKLLTRYPGALGIKNGYTNAARTSFVGAAERDGHTLVVTMMRANSRPHIEAALLLDWGFAATAAGAAPIGELVAADPRPEVLSAQSAAGATLAGDGSAAASSRTDGEGLPVGPAALLLAGTGAGMLLLRQHRRQTALERQQGTPRGRAR